MIPEAAVTYAPVLAHESAVHFPAFKRPSIFFGQVEKESLWKVNATLKTSREFGAGLGQFTRAYRADGSVRFDAAQEMRDRFKQELAGWNEANLYNPTYQLRALVLKNRTNFVGSPGANDTERTAFMLASYNAGLGLVNKDRVLCSHTPGCNPNFWFGNTEKQGFQSRVKWQGYGDSAFDITRKYVTEIINVRSVKYRALSGEK